MRAITRMGLAAAAAALAAGGTLAAGEPRGAVLDGGSSLRCRLTWMTEHVRRKDGSIYRALVQRVSKSKWSLKTVPAEKAGFLPARPAEGWARPDFDDSSWPRLRGRLPFPSAGIGLVRLRGKFTVERPVEMRLNLRFQGGAAVYVNGREIARAGLPEGGLTPETLAEPYPREAYVHDGGKSKGKLLTQHPWHLSRYPQEFEQRVRQIKGATVPASALRRGVNVLAVEIHRAPGAEFMFRQRSRDMWARLGFDGLSLAAASGAGAAPRAGGPKGLRVWNLQVTETPGAADLAAPGERLRPLRLTGPRNGAFSAQVAVGSGAPVKGLAVKVSDLSGPAGRIPASAVRVRYGAEAPRINNYARSPGRFEALAGSAPAEVKALRDGKGRPVAAGAALQPVWLTVRVPKDAKPGEYRGKAVISAAGGAPVELPVELRVVGWTLPDPVDFFATVGSFQSPESLAMQYKVKMWSERHWKLIEKSLKLLGELGVKTAYVTAQRRTHLGNAHSMVRWTRGGGGKLKPDLSIAERYLDLVARHMGKVPVVCLYCWEQNAVKASNNPSHLTKEQRRQYQREILITVRDPASGELREEKGPGWGTPECREFWKPVAEGIRKILAARGMAGSLMLGIAGDYKPTEEALGDLKAATGGARWVLHSHTIYHGLGPAADHPTGYIAAAWGGHCRHPDPDAGRGYGWKMPFRRVMTRSFPTHSATQRMLLEYLVTGVATRKNGMKYEPDYGLHGVGRLGADFWPVLRGKPGRPGTPLFGRYPETAWGQLNVGLWLPALFAPGPDGPVATVRSEMLRQNQQELEARIFIEKALAEKAARARLGGDLARRARELLDLRVRLANSNDVRLIQSADVTGMAGRLYELAAGAAGKLGKR